MAINWVIKKQFINFSLKDDEAIRQYLSASDSYLDEKLAGSKRARMLYPFPKLSESCPLCHGVGCARWKGYFTRQWLCGYFGSGRPMVIHVGTCKRLHRDFSYFPDVLIPGKRLSRRSWQDFTERFQVVRIIKMCVDELVGSVKLEDFTFATSSAYNLLYAAIRPLRINHELLSIRPPQKSSVFEFYTLPKLVIKNLFNWRQCQWHAFHAMIFNPPWKKYCRYFFEPTGLE